MFVVGDVGEYLREQREHARLSVRQLANLAGVSNPYLSQVERGLRKPSAEVLQQIARGLRISAEALYVRAGILDDEGRPDVEAAVHADPDLNERQRRVLLDIYASFRAENRRAGEAAAAEQVTAPAEPEPITEPTPPSEPTTESTTESRVEPTVELVPEPAVEPGAASPVARATAKRAAARVTRRTTTRSTRSTRASRGAAAAPGQAPATDGDVPPDGLS
jgi:transcriptional regulator with XRE-family HTH domain